MVYCRLFFKEIQIHEFTSKSQFVETFPWWGILSTKYYSAYSKTKLTHLSTALSHHPLRKKPFSNLNTFKVRCRKTVVFVFCLFSFSSKFIKNNSFKHVYSNGRGRVVFPYIYAPMHLICHPNVLNNNYKCEKK